ncbi:MAG: hypothetical protein ACR2F8_02955 [Caulobacteraceae bacterium]
MVAYSFKGAFISPILAGTKRQTIRLPRKRHARPGEEVQLYFGMRTRSCALIGRATCQRVSGVRIDLAEQSVVLDDAIAIVGGALNDFARSDGFEGHPPAGLTPWGHMHRWWRLIHQGDIFVGTLIEWDQLRPSRAP